MTRGKYIVIEGPNGTGKTTQADLLIEYLAGKGITAHHIKEPGGSPVGEAIRGVLLNDKLDRTPMTNALLFTANRHELWHAVISPALERGEWVIGVRNYWSSLAIQGYGQGMDVGIIQAITDTFTHPRYIKPDIGIILNFDNESERNARIGRRNSDEPDRFELENEAFQRRVNKGYEQVAKQFNAHTIDAGKSIRSVQGDIQEIIIKHLK